MGEVHLRLLATNGFHAKTKNERLTAAGSRCYQNLKNENFRSSFDVKKLPQKACRTCSTITFPHLTNHIINLWCCRCRCEKSQKIFLLSRKIYCERKLSYTRLYCGNKTGNPEQAVSLHITRLDKYEENGCIWNWADHEACLFPDLPSNSLSLSYFPRFLTWILNSRTVQCNI